MQKGDFMKLGNLTIRYNWGNIGKALKNVSFYVSGYNLAVFTSYKGFDPEVNVSKTDFFNTGIPSIGIDYVGYPSVRTFTFGINFSLN
jgi:iron complex outermembrane receptor protein